jgi:type II secretory pathway pseudopilin PulG
VRLSADRIRRDAGFTLVEIIVALGILMLVVVALLPQLVVGIRSTATAREISQAKGEAQGQLDRMRNLPFHVAPAAGDYRDVLDFHFRNLMPPAVTPTCSTSGGYASPQTGWVGYVSTTATRCSYEPSGPFYRSARIVPASSGSSGFTVVVNTQFLSGATPPLPVSPPAGYDTQTTNGARPASSQLGITVTILYTTRGTLRPVSTYTQISDQPASPTRIKVEAAVATLEVGSVTSANTGKGPVSLTAGLLNLTGSLSYASTVSGNLRGTTAGLATGEQSSGASASVAAPPSLAATTVNAVGGSLWTSGCSIACWGGTRLDVASLSADQGLPNAGTAAAPMQSLLTDTVNGGISFGNSLSDNYRAGLGLTLPLVRLDPNAAPAASGISTGCAVGATGAQSYIAGSGYLRSSLSPEHAVESCAVGRTSSISIFPTDFAPRGVVLLELRKASARCLVSGTTHTSSATHDFEAVVKYFDGAEYQIAGTATPANDSDPLDALDLAATAVGGGKFLSDYIASWSSLTGGEVVRTEEAGLAKVQLPGVVTIASQPVRPVPDLEVTTGDPTSTVSVTLGALSCSAQDER